MSGLPKPRMVLMLALTLALPGVMSGCRAKLMRCVTDCLAAAANPAKGGFVREALTGSYPKLASLLEAMFQKLRHDTEVVIGPGRDL